jgi:hypothetical protein
MFKAGLLSWGLMSPRVISRLSITVSKSMVQMFSKKLISILMRGLPFRTGKIL